MMQRMTLSDCRKELGDGNPIPNDLSKAMMLVKLHRVTRSVTGMSYKDALEMYAPCKESEMKSYAEWKSLAVGDKPELDLLMDLWCQSSNENSLIHFGKYSRKKYGEVLQEDASYCKWVLNTGLHEASCPDLGKFGHWLMKKQGHYCDDASAELEQLKKNYNDLLQAYEHVTNERWEVVTESN